MSNRLYHIVLIALFAAAIAGPAAYAVVRGQAEFALMASVGLLMLILVLRSPYRLPVLLLVLCLLSADSHIHPVKILALKLRWAVFGALVFKELGSWAFTKQLRVRLTSTHLTVLAFLVLALSSSLYSVDPSLTFQRSVSLIMFFVAVFLYFWRQTTSEESRLDLIRFAAKLTPLLYLGELAYSLWSSGSGWSGVRLRAISGNPSGLGLVVMLTLPLLYGWLLTEKKHKGLGRLAYRCGGLLLGFVLLLLSGSRASMLGLSGALLIITFRLAPVYFLGLSFVIFAGMVGVFALGERSIMVPETGRFQTITERLESPDLGGRGEAWSLALRTGWERPIFGHGFGATEETFGRLEFKEHYGAYPHNFLLHTFIDLGLLGLTVVVLLHASLLRKALSAFAPQNALRDSGLPVLMTGLYLAGLLNASFESWMFSAGSPGAFPFWLAAMMTIRYGVLHEESKRERLQERARNWYGARA